MMARFLPFALLYGVFYTSHVFAQISQVKPNHTAPFIPAQHAQWKYDGSSSSSGMDDYIDTPIPTPYFPIPTPYFQSSDSSSASSSSSDHDVVQYDDKLHKPPTSLVPRPAEITVPPPRYTPSVPAPIPPPISTIAPFTQTIRENYEATREASARAARTMSGKQDKGFFTLAILITGCGVAAVIVVGVYLRRRSREERSTEQGAVTTPYPLARSSQRPPPTLTHRPSRAESVYDDPLGTRFSSIVMITPGGDGVCIL